LSGIIPAIPSVPILTASSFTSPNRRPPRRR
jgi:hypothetical protein